jgi:hypothetical protein
MITVQSDGGFRPTSPGGIPLRPLTNWIIIDRMSLKRTLLILPVVVLLLSACAPRAGGRLKLGNFSENGVEVTIHLQAAADGTAVLSATFTPTEAGYHLYSKDHPREGVDGLGRPTLLELTESSQMQAAGELTDNIPAGILEGTELMVYPPGPVTLSLSVILPEGDARVPDQVSVTYMACTATTCREPVEGKVVTVTIPGADSIRP